MFWMSSYAASISTQPSARAASASSMWRTSTTRIFQRRWSPPCLAARAALYVKTKFATAVGSPSTLAVDPLRQHIPANEEQPIALFIPVPFYVTDLEEGLVIIGDPNLKSKTPGVLTLLDGNPRTIS